MSSSRKSYAEKFNLLLDLFPHPDRKGCSDPKKRRWKGVELERASGGGVSSAYISSLRNGDIARPGMEHLHLIAKVMGFPFRLWLTDPEDWKLKSRGDPTAAEPGKEAVMRRAELLEQLFQSVYNRQTGQPYTNREIAERSQGRLAEEDVAGLREGSIPDPTIGQLLALCDVFDVDVSYWSEGREKKPLLDQHTVEALRDSKRYLALQKSTLSDDHMDMVLLLMDQLNNLETGRGEKRPGRGTEDAPSS